MHFVDILLIGIALSMDAFAVSISDSLIYKKYSPLAIALAFGIFQAAMPLAGFFAGGIFTGFITRYSGIITFVILGAIGGKMIYDAFHPEDEDHTQKEMLSMKVLLLQAVATSIDALAVGVSFVGTSFAGEWLNIYSAAAIIGVTTFLLSRLALLLGEKASALFGSRPELIGGIILVLLGIKSLLF